MNQNHVLSRIESATELGLPLHASCKSFGCFFLMKSGALISNLEVINCKVILVDDLFIR